MSKDVLPVFRSNPHHPLPVASGLLRAKGCLPVKVANVCHQFSPLACEQIDDINAFGGTLQTSRCGREEMDMRIGCYPALFSPGQDLVDDDVDVLGLRPNLENSRIGLTSNPLLILRYAFPSGKSTTVSPSMYVQQ